MGFWAEVTEYYQAIKDGQTKNIKGVHNQGTPGYLRFGRLYCGVMALFYWVIGHQKHGAHQLNLKLLINKGGQISALQRDAIDRLIANKKIDTGSKNAIIKFFTNQLDDKSDYLTDRLLGNVVNNPELVTKEAFFGQLKKIFNDGIPESILKSCDYFTSAVQGSFRIEEFITVGHLASFNQQDDGGVFIAQFQQTIDFLAAYAIQTHNYCFTATDETTKQKYIQIGLTAISDYAHKLLTTDSLDKDNKALSLIHLLAQCWDPKFIKSFNEKIVALQNNQRESLTLDPLSKAKLDDLIDIRLKEKIKSPAQVGIDANTGATLLLAIGNDQRSAASSESASAVPLGEISAATDSPPDRSLSNSPLIEFSVFSDDEVRPGTPSSQRYKDNIESDRPEV